MHGQLTRNYATESVISTHQLPINPQGIMVYWQNFDVSNSVHILHRKSWLIRVQEFKRHKSKSSTTLLPNSQPLPIALCTWPLFYNVSWAFLGVLYRDVMYGWEFNRHLVLNTFTHYESTLNTAHCKTYIQETVQKYISMDIKMINLRKLWYIHHVNLRKQQQELPHNDL